MDHDSRGGERLLLCTHGCSRTYLFFLPLVYKPYNIGPRFTLAVPMLHVSYDFLTQLLWFFLGA